MGKPETAFKKKEVKKSPVSIGIVGTQPPIYPSNLYPSPLWSRTNSTPIVLLAFVVIAPLLIEQLKLLPQIWAFILNILSKVGLVSK